MINLFCGYDHREAIGYGVFVERMLSLASEPVMIVPLHSHGLPTGSNDFTTSRFLVPQLMGWKGRAIFCDAVDMLLTEDIANLNHLFDPDYAVQVVKHPTYSTRHKMKYVGTDMECPNRDYPRKNWASVMLINCAHPAWRTIHESSIAASKPIDLLQFKFIPDDAIGALPEKWNRLVDEGHPVDGAAIWHWTAGTPAFKYYHDAPGAEHWHCARAELLEVS
jgi:hypothetical protein